MSDKGTDDILSILPKGIRSNLIAAFNNIQKNYREGRWEASVLNGGKFSECVYTVIRGHFDGKIPSKPLKITNFLDSCVSLQKNTKGKFSDSLRQQIPKMLIAIYDIRNNRSIGHAGGDVDPNHMDAFVVANISKWVLAELIRNFHESSTDEASKIVESLIEKSIPSVWKVDGKYRSLIPDMPMKDRALLILYVSTASKSDSELSKDCEHSNLSVFKKSVLVALHKSKLIEYNKSKGKVTISPLGIRYVEENLPLDI